jgi:multidrug resistance efflux pump
MRLARPSAPTRTLARVLSGVLVAVALVLALAPWVQTSFGEGRVIAYAPLDRRQTIAAPVDGRVARWYVAEGSRVKEGDPIADIADVDPEILSRLRTEREAVVSRIEAAKARIAAITQRIEALSASRDSAIEAAQSRVRMAVQRTKAAEQAITAAEAAERTTQANIDRQAELEKKGLSSRRAFELAELDHARAETDLARAHAAFLGAESEELALRSDLMKVQADTSAMLEDARAALASADSERASATAELARLDTRLSRQSAQAVVAPREGVVLRLEVAPGAELIKAGDPLVVLVPDTDARAVEMWIKGTDVPLVSEGREVRLQFDGWPAVQFSGWPSVAIGTFGGRIALVDATDDGKGKFRVLVVPMEGEEWPSAQYLRQGGRAHGWILLDEVRLGWELWRQFNGFPPSLSTFGEGEPGSDKASSKSKKGSDKP